MRLLPSPSLCLFLLALTFTAAAQARTIYVDDRAGNDAWTGASEQPSGKDGPFATIQPAVDAAKAGDTVSLAKGSGPYVGEVDVKTQGTAAAPITFNGNGCSLLVSIDIAEGPWTQADGKWVLDQPRIPPNTKHLNQRAVAFYQGTPVWIRKQPLPGDLCTASVNADGQFCFQFVGDVKPPFAGLSIPIKPTINGLAILNASYWHVDNLHVFGAGNDGFNLHGRGQGNVIRNCAAFFCGDEGTSTHDMMEVEISDSLFAFNTSSVVDINKSHTTYRNVISAYNNAPGFSMTGEGGVYSINDSLSAANAGPEAGRDLPVATTKTVNLTEFAAEPGVMEKIKTWGAKHPKLALLLKMEADRAKGVVACAQAAGTP